MILELGLHEVNQLLSHQPQLLLGSITSNHQNALILKVSEAVTELHKAGWEGIPDTALTELRTTAASSSFDAVDGIVTCSVLPHYDCDEDRGASRTSISCGDLTNATAGLENENVHTRESMPQVSGALEQGPSISHSDLLAMASPTHLQEETPPSYLLCPISSILMKEPMVALDGYSYERVAIGEMCILNLILYELSPYDW